MIFFGLAEMCDFMCQKCQMAAYYEDMRFSNWMRVWHEMT